MIITASAKGTSPESPARQVLQTIAHARFALTKFRDTDVERLMLDIHLHLSATPGRR